MNSENVFVSEHFLTLCGFTPQQLYFLPGSRTTSSVQYFNLKDVIGVGAGSEYCGMIQPPSKLSVESLTLGSGIHNFTGNILRKICSVSNHDNKHCIIQKIKNPVWYETVKIAGGILHISLSCSDCNTLFIN